MHLYSKKWIQLCFILPTLIIFCIYLIYPIFTSLYLSFFEVPSFNIKAAVLTGFDNFNSVLKDEVFYISLKNTLICVIVELILMVPFGLLLGILINKNFSGNSVVRVATYTPVILSGIMCALVWSFILDPGYGLINSFLDLVGLPMLKAKWIGGLKLTPYSVGFIDSWKGVGFYGVLYMSGLKMIPSTVFEAAEIDGATKKQQLFYITIPLLKETTKVAVLMITINAINAYASVYMLTNGGPNNRSHVLATYLYKTQIGSRMVGVGAAIAVIMFILVMIFTIVYLNINNRQIDE